MKFLGLSSSAPATRGFWRVVLVGDLLDLGYFFSNPLAGWPAKVEAFRTAVNTGAAGVAALASPASETPGAGLVGARAVLDIHILGVDQGDTVGAIARRLNGLVVQVDVDSVQLVENSDPIARDAALDHATEGADPFGLKALTGTVGTVLFVGGLIAAAYIVYQVSKRARA